MNIELNKCYRTRDGRKARIICVDAKQKQPVIGLVDTNGVEIFARYGLDGSWILDGKKRGSDLISEWVDKPEMDRSVLPPWIKVIAMDEDGRWFGYAVAPIVLECTWTPGDETYGEHCYIPPSHAPKWTGDWKDSLLVFED